MAARLTYHRTRILLLLLGVGVSVATTLAAWYRGAPPSEVLAPALYMPVAAGAIFWSYIGGFVAATISSLIYGVILADQVEVVGLGPFTTLLTNRILFYFFLAIIVAAGIRFIEERLHKLEIYDEIDDLTGLYNSSFFLKNSDLETSRANRYQTFFAVTDVRIDPDAFSGMGGRRRKRLVRDLASRIEIAIRGVDRAARLEGADGERFLIVLPETGPEGAAIFSERLEVAISEFMREREADGGVSVTAITYPEEPEALARIREEVEALDTRRRRVAAES